VNNAVLRDPCLVVHQNTGSVALLDLMPGSNKNSQNIVHAVEENTMLRGKTSLVACVGDIDEVGQGHVHLLLLYVKNLPLFGVIRQAENERAGLMLM
jgi:hypothetical protein